MIAGGVMSLTDTWKVQVLVFPDRSDAVKLTIVVPTGKELPGGRPFICETVTGPQLSVAPGILKFTIALHSPGGAYRVITDGQKVNCGGWTSFNVIVKLQESIFPDSFVQR